MSIESVLQCYYARIAAVTFKKDICNNQGLHNFYHLQFAPGKYRFAPGK